METTASSAEAPGRTDAYCTTGTSPSRERPARRRTYERLHLLGIGSVGGELLRLLAGSRRRLVGVSDSTGTLCDESGIDPLDVLHWKQAGRFLRERPDAHLGNAAEHIGLVDADILVDATATDLGRDGWTTALDAALARGACLAAAAKAAFCVAGAEWLTGPHRSRIGCNAVLGGTGQAFTRELPELRRRTQAIAIVGNASTTAILDAIERGGVLADGIAEAQRLGYLEPDPELDLRGVDAAVKLAIIAGIITGRSIEPRSIPCDDIRAVDHRAVRARARAGATTRLVGRLWEDGTLEVRYEAVGRDTVLAAPCGRVVYEYLLSGNERRIHIGTGLGAAATAGALWADINAVARAAQGGVR
jgi:homoserine dehydrogenase